MKKNTDAGAPEFSYLLPIEKIPAGGLDVVLKANEQERKALAKRFDLLELPKLEANLTIYGTRADRGVAISGHLVAEVVQACVVSLEPLKSSIDRAINVLFVPPEEGEQDVGKPELDAQEAETEIIEQGVIDLGEWVAQSLGIALDPYPRKPDLAFVDVEYGTKKATVSPLAALASLRKKKED